MYSLSPTIDRIRSAKGRPHSTERINCCSSEKVHGSIRRFPKQVSHDLIALDIFLSISFSLISIRLKYMLDVLLAIKNNNVNKIPQYDPTLAEHLRKVLRGMLVNGKYVTTLNITLEDLLRADQRGKWWVVGSAWTGNVSDIGAAAGQSAKAQKQHADSTKFSANILELAKKQRMNTDDRKNVFCILMTAEVIRRGKSLVDDTNRFFLCFRTLSKHLRSSIICPSRIIRLL